MKKYLILVCIICTSLFSCVYAGNLVKKVYFSPYPILIDNKEYSSEMPILSYQDRTYVALREFSEMVGVKIDFVDETIIIDTINKEKSDIEHIQDSSKNEVTEKEENLITKAEDNENYSDNLSEVVYITKSGTKYHVKMNCTKGVYYKTTLEEAKRNGYTMCKKCIN